MSSVPSSAIFFVGPPQIQRGNAHTRGALCGNLSNCVHQIFVLAAPAILFNFLLVASKCSKINHGRVSLRIEVTAHPCGKPFPSIDWRRQVVFALEFRNLDQCLSIYLVVCLAIRTAAAIEMHISTLICIVTGATYCPVARCSPVMTSSPGLAAHHALTFSTFLAYASRLTYV